jgi:hypothetical protein
MERQYVGSTMIESIGYDFSTGVLEVEFKSDHAIWQYSDFPESMWYEFSGADSKGKYFNANIREQYTPQGYRVG